MLSTAYPLVIYHVNILTSCTEQGQMQNEKRTETSYSTKSFTTHLHQAFQEYTFNQASTSSSSMVFLRIRLMIGFESGCNPHSAFKQLCLL